MVNTGLMEMMMAARLALVIMTPTWNRVMLKQMLMTPRARRYPQSLRVR